MTSIPTISLNDGHSIPQLGFGVLQIDPPRPPSAVSVALEIGYGNDTAEMYRNEQGVGDAVRAWGLDRGDVYVTSKLNNGSHRPGRRAPSVRRDARAAGLRLRRPVPDPLAAADAVRGDSVSTWKT